MTAKTKDDKFWLEDGNLVLLVDGVYFKLYRELLIRQYGLFKDILSLTVGPSSQEGSSVEHPINLPDISANDFQLLLSHMLNVADSDPEEFAMDDQLRLLRVAHRLQAGGIVYRLVKLLIPALDPLARLSLCIELSLDELQQERIQGRSIPRSSATKHTAPPPASGTVDNTQPTGKSDQTSRILADAFVVVVLDFDVKLPFHDPRWPLSASWRLHLATAREQVAEARRKATGDWVRQSGAAINQFWFDKIARPVSKGLVEHAPANEGETFMPSADVQRELVRQYMRKMYSTDGLNK